ncbi:MAG: hypothetical protein HYW25_00590 [Candidatus Aenigmarchaeota archaeon]|nr:hypothetical protein [Candidatus Aenigmarchaeota archaeon]
MPADKICPKCRKGPIGIWMGGVLGIFYLCNNCGYRGPVIMEEDAKRKAKRRMKKKVKE